jgi:hypothetical protein
LRMTMPNVVQKYLRHFELQQRVQTLKYVSRVRRLPRWVPSKSLLLRFMTKNSLSWARRSAVIHASWDGRADLKLIQGNGNGNGRLSRTTIPIDGQDVAVGNGSGGVDGALAATGSASDGDSGQHADGNNISRPLAVNLANNGQPEQSEAGQPKADKQLPFLAIGRSVDAAGNNRQH